MDSDSLTSCPACDCNKHAFETLDVCTSSLRQLCLKAVAKNSSIFAAEHLSYFPNEILDDFKWHLSTYDLLRYSTIFEKACIHTSCVWEKHVLKLFGRQKFRKHYFILTNCHVLDNCYQTPQVIYMRHLCSEMMFHLGNMWDMDTNCRCNTDLEFYLQFSPSLTIRWPRVTLIRSKLIGQAIVQNVHHLDVRIRNVRSNAFDTDLMQYLSSCKQLNSICFQSGHLLHKFYLSERSINSRPEERIAARSQSASYRPQQAVVERVEGVEATLYDNDIKFLTSEQFKENGIKKLNIRLWSNPEYSLCRQDWFGTALRKLTHLTLNGEELITNTIMNELICGLFEVFRDPLREPMKCLCLVFHEAMHLDFDFGKFTGQTFAVEQIEVLEGAISDEGTFRALFTFLECNRSLSHLNLHGTSIDIPIDTTEVYAALLDVCFRSNLEFLTTPIVNDLDIDICQILKYAGGLSYLKIQGPCAAGNMHDCLQLLVKNKHLRTLSLGEVNLGEVGRDVLVSVLTSECNQITCLDISECGILGEDLITAARVFIESRSRRKLHILDISLNKITRKQQTTLKTLYTSITDILIVDIADKMEMEFVAQM